MSNVVRSSFQPASRELPADDWSHEETDDPLYADPAQLLQWWRSGAGGRVASSASAFELLTRFDTGQRCSRGFFFLGPGFIFRPQELS